MSKLHPGACRHGEYQLGCVEYAQLSERAGDACEICRRPREKSPHKRLYIDHDHGLGKWAVRGIVCPSCNVRLGRRLGFELEPAVARYLANPFHATIARYLNRITRNEEDEQTGPARQPTQADPRRIERADAKAP